MTMTDEYLAFAFGLAKTAGHLIKDGFEQAVDIESKPDDSPVTEIDKQINQLVIDRIREAYPSHGVLGEEADLGAGDESYRWICDPLDGTKAFILGVPNSVFMLALMENGELVLAVIYDPFTDRMYHARKHGGSFCNGTPMHVSNQPLRGGYILLGSSSYASIDAVKQAGGRVEPVSGGGYKYMLIARGKAVGTLKDGADFHDVAVGALIIEEAGGKVTAFDGSRLKYDEKVTGVIMSNSIAHPALVKIALSIYG